MDGDSPDRDFLDQIARQWPTDAWRDVHVLVAVSGGADSMALLRSLLELKRRGGGAGRLYAGHVNHQLRSQQSDDDQAWVQRECRRLDLPLIVETSQVAAVAQRDGDGIEAAARKERYRLLTAAAERLGARFVATAHHRDDDVETTLLRLFRGTGLQGLCGIPTQRSLSDSVTAVRPMLRCWRHEARGYLKSLGQRYRTDSSNVELRFARNRLREVILPQLRDHFNPAIDSAVARTIDQLAAARDTIGAAVEEILIECDVQGCAEEISLLLAPLAGHQDYLIAETLRTAWSAAGLPEQAMTHDKWTRLAKWVICQDGVPENLPGNLHIDRRGQRMVIRRGSPNRRANR